MIYKAILTFCKLSLITWLEISREGSRFISLAVVRVWKCSRTGFSGIDPLIVKEAHHVDFFV